MICRITGSELCEGCNGPLYVCDPAENHECKKTFCHECDYTSKAECSTDGRPLCVKELFKKELTQ